VSYFILEIINKKNARPKNIALYVLLLGPLVIFTTIFLGDIGTDVENYRKIFQNAESFPSEPGFSAIMIALKWLGISYEGFINILATVELILLALILSKLKDPLIFLLIYAGSFFLNFHFNMIRNSLALLFLGLIYAFKGRLGIFSLISSVLIHFSSIFSFGLFQLGEQRPRNKILSKIIFALLGSALLMLLFFQGHDIFSRLDDYLNLDIEKKAIYPASILKLSLIWIFYLNGGRLIFLIFYSVLVIAAHLISPIFDRALDIILYIALLDTCLRVKIESYRTATFFISIALIVATLLIPWQDCTGITSDNWCLSR
jgi:hypothetical protein